MLVPLVVMVKRWGDVGGFAIVVNQTSQSTSWPIVLLAEAIICQAAFVDKTPCHFNYLPLYKFYAAIHFKRTFLNFNYRLKTNNLSLSSIRLFTKISSYAEYNYIFW